MTTNMAVTCDWGALSKKKVVPETTVFPKTPETNVSPKTSEPNVPPKTPETNVSPTTPEPNITLEQAKNVVETIGAQPATGDNRGFAELFAAQRALEAANPTIDTPPQQRRTMMPTDILQRIAHTLECAQTDLVINTNDAEIMIVRSKSSLHCRLINASHDDPSDIYYEYNPRMPERLDQHCDNLSCIEKPVCIIDMDKPETANNELHFEQSIRDAKLVHTAPQTYTQDTDQGVLPPKVCG